MINCNECKKLFNPTHWNQKICSYDCKRIKKNRNNLNLISKKRGYIGYGSKKCIVCKYIFKPNTSVTTLCSGKCKIIRSRHRKNKSQKIKHLIDKQRPNYVLSRVLRTCLYNIIRQKLLTNKSHKSHRYCSYDVPEFKKHIESKFEKGMSWENWGEWHIDHIKPLSKFNFVKEDGSENLSEILIANSLNNLQPLWAKDNLRKHNKWGGDPYDS